MKKIALIRSYCNNEEKENFLIENIKKLKNFNFDIAIMSILPISKKIMEVSDYCFVSKDNPILFWPEKAIQFFQEIYEKNQRFTLSVCVEDYGYSVLHQIKKISEIFLSYDYDYYYHLEYDTILTEKIDFFLKNPAQKLMFSSKRNETVWKTGSHLMIFNKENLENFISFISKESYLSNDCHYDAYAFLHDIQKKIRAPISEITIEDKFFHYSNKNLFSCINSKFLKVFIIKNIISTETVKLFFYHLEAGKTVKIKVDDLIIEKTIQPADIIDLKCLPSDKKKVNLIYENENFDISEEIHSVKNNVMFF